MRCLAAISVFVVAVSAAGDTFLVTNGGDSGDGSLRRAIEQANTVPGADSIAWNSPLTVTLGSPLPPITEMVTVGTNPLPFWPANIAPPPVLTIDGSQTSGDGLRVSADRVAINNVAVAHFRSGDGIVVDGNDAILNWIEASDEINGIRLRGLRAGVYGADLHDNRDSGLVIDSASRDNSIGRYRYGCLPTGDVCDVSPGGNTFRANGTGMRVDGEHNTFIYAEPVENRADGAVVSGAGNPLDSVFASRNGRYGVMLLAPNTPPLVASCNGAMPFEVGTKYRLATPRITAGTRYLPLMNVSGDAHAAPNRPLLVVIYTIAPSPIDCGTFFGQAATASVTTDASGDVHFDVNAPGARGEALYAAAIELDGKGNPVAMSELSAPFAPLTNIEPFADLSVEMTAPPSVVFGQEMTIEIRVVNHGPGASAAYELRFPLSSGVEYVGNACAGACEEPPLAPGQTVVIEQRVRVIGRGTVLPYIVQLRGYGLNDPNPSNNDAAITIAVNPAPPRRRGVLH